MPPSEGICNGYTRRTTKTTFATYRFFDDRFLRPTSRSSTIFPLARSLAPIFHSLFGKDRERGRGRERKFVCPRHECAREENEVRFFPPLAEETRRNVSHVVSVIYGNRISRRESFNRTVFRDGRGGRREERRSKERDRSGAKIPQPADWWWREAGITNTRATWLWIGSAGGNSGRRRLASTELPAQKGLAARINVGAKPRRRSAWEPTAAFASASREFAASP